MLALALVRHRFFGRRAANVLVLVPMATPEVVIGAALLSMFVYLDVARGFPTLLIAHVMFSISFVVVVVRSRLIGFDPALEEAAADLGAGPAGALSDRDPAAARPGGDRGGGARLRALDRRLRGLELQLGHDGDLPPLHLRRLAARDPGRGQRALDDAVRARRGGAVPGALAAAPRRAPQPAAARRPRRYRQVRRAEASRVVAGGDDPGGDQGPELARVEAQALVEDRDGVLAEVLGRRAARSG